MSASSKALVLIFIGMFCLGKTRGILYPINPEVPMNTTQRIECHGYSAVSHRVQTEDDYILVVYHVFKKNLLESDTKNKSTVLFVHGMGATPELFISLGKNGSAPYYLIEKGMDVWLFAARGSFTPFKEKHVKYTWNDRAFWDYSMQEIGIYDIPATIDTVLEYTGQKQLSVIGHSGGGPYVLIGLSQRTEYNQKIKVLISWAGVPLMKHSTYGAAYFLAGLTDLWRPLANLIGLYDLNPFPEVTKKFATNVCSDSHWLKLCIYAGTIAASQKSVLFNPEDMQILASLKVKLSIRVVLQFADNFYKGVFQKEDYGARKNLAVYGQRIPPDYNLTAVTAPVVFFSGPADLLVVLKDAIYSAEQLPNTIMIYEVKHAKFNHIDYLVGRGSDKLVYQPVYEIIHGIDQGIVPPPLKSPITLKAIK